MSRFHMLSQEVANFHEWTPQKRRSMVSERDYQTTNLYRSIERPESGADQLDATQKSWIGKYFIPSGYQPTNPSKSNYVYEKEIANYCKPWGFQVLQIGHPDAPKYMARSTGIDVVSKPDMAYRPTRINIFVDHKDVIRKVEYF